MTDQAISQQATAGQQATEDASYRLGGSRMRAAFRMENFGDS